MRAPVAASLLVVGMVVSAHGAARGADADAVAADEQLLRTADLGTDGPALLDYFRTRTPQDADRKRVSLLIRQLGDDSFDVREKASAELTGLGPRVIALLRPALQDRDPEVVRRVSECLRRLEHAEKNTAAGPDLPAAAVRLVAVRKPAGAAEVLLAYLPCTDEEAIVEEIETALAVLAVREGKPEPALAEALTDADPLRRGIAGAALTRAGNAHRNAVRKLLQDPDLGVRLRVGLALAGAREKEAVPVLIDLLGRLPPEQAGTIEDFLVPLAGEKVPAVGLGADAAGREKCRAAWAAWWREHGDAVEMPALEGPRPQLGHTLIVIADTGKVLEVGRDGKCRWEVGGLGCPFEARVLPGGRILVAEYNGQVTERNLKGEILWKKGIQSAMQCQRLPNGNTFVVTITGIIEVDPAGKDKVVYAYNQPGSSLVAAKKLRNGQIIAVGGDGACMRLDAAGNELSRFSVGRISNNCLDVLPNGHILVPKFFDGKVTEYDAGGKVVWEIDYPSPFSAQRLPNGNTLVACHEPMRVVELDRAGKVVWEQPAESLKHRPWFASRR